MRSGDISALLQPGAFPHGVEKLEVVETHISWVVLTGQFAYKIKKPVDLGFVDFTRLERRKYFCDEELRLNKRTAPELYLDVVPIARTAGSFRIGEQPAIEYAVRMRQFPGEARLDRQLESGRLTMSDALAMAKVIARFHLSLTAKAPKETPAERSRILQFALQNFEQIRAALKRDQYHALLSRLENWTCAQADLLGETYGNRAKAGFVREGHGDLHLANMVKLDGRIVLFDCLEFDPAMRWLDVMNDIAFLVMDLMAHGREDLALALLNHYLEQTGDYQGVSVLRFYLVYRCLVRAKVAAMQPGGSGATTAVRDGGRIRRYLQLAESLVEHSLTPRLFLMHGFSGAGKSWLSERLIGPLGAIRVRSDLERKRLHGLPPGQSSASGIEAGLYDTTATERTYHCLMQHCETGLRSGFNMIADASFLQQRQRQRFLDLASELQAAVAILDCTAPVEMLRKRIQARAADPERISEADLSVLDHQLDHFDPFTDQEKPYVIRIPMDGGLDISGLLKQLGRPRCAGAERRTMFSDSADAHHPQKKEFVLLNSCCRKLNSEVNHNECQ